MSCSSALDKFINLYITAYQDTLSELPRYYPLGEASDCIEGSFDASSKAAVYWKPFVRKSVGDFTNVEHALNIQLHADINPFYGRYFSAPLYFTSSWGEGELLQVWNQQDFEYLQQNVIGHLIMKQKLKQNPTWFIGVLDDGDKMLTINNDDGSVWIEIPGEEPSVLLADSLASFIEQLLPRITPPVIPVDEPVEQWQHPGIWQRMKHMWHDLIRKKS